MFEALKRFFSHAPVARDLADASEWAQRRGYGFRRVKGAVGFVIDGVFEARPWRMEWGPSQRSYIVGHELRLRMENALGSDVQMLLLSRQLMDALERQTFEEFTDNVQTQISSKSPEEVRWLVMFQKLSFATLKPLRSRFGGVASDPVLGLSWLEGPLSNALERAANGLLADDPPFVLMTLRGRGYMRLQMELPEPNTLSAALALFEVAVTQAMRVSGAPTDDPAVWGASASTAWQSLRPDVDTGTHADTGAGTSTDIGTDDADARKR